MPATCLPKRRRSTSSEFSGKSFQNKSAPARPVAMSFDAAGCSWLFNARIASRMTANGTPRRFAAVPNFGSDRSEADIRRASGDEQGAPTETRYDKPLDSEPVEMKSKSVLQRN